MVSSTPNLANVRRNYVQALQGAAQQVLMLVSTWDRLTVLYQAAALAGTFTDAELAAWPGTQHLAAADVAAATASLTALRAGVSAELLAELAAVLGAPA